MATGLRLGVPVRCDHGPAAREAPSQTTARRATHFGWSPSPSDGDTAIAGASVRRRQRPENSGSAYLFDVATGQQLAKLLPDDGAASDEFGGSVAISGDTAIIGAWYDDDNGEDSGAAYLYDVSASLCPPDLNGDGSLDILDFVTFQLCWAAGISVADCDANGEFNVLDFVCFQQQFVEGCD